MSDLSDEYYRVIEHGVADDEKEPLVVRERRSGVQAALSVVEEYQPALLLQLTQIPPLTIRARMKEQATLSVMA
jgi:hypothetical protein